jgi:hypothetical protein
MQLHIYSRSRGKTNIFLDAIDTLQSLLQINIIASSVPPFLSSQLGFLGRPIFDPEDGSDTFLRNVSS